MRRAGNDLGVGCADLVGDVRQKLAGRGAGLYDLAEHILRETELVNDVPRPVAALGVEKLGGGSNGIFSLLGTGEEIFEKIRYEKHIFGVCEFIRVFNERIELINGIEV